MLQLKDLPDKAILEKFASRYPEVDINAVMQFLHLLGVASELSVGLDNFLRRYDLLQGRWWVLILLMREDSFISSPSKLAEQSGVSRATMTGLLDGLAREGLIQRIVDEKDKRQTQIKLTKKGQQKLDEVMPDYYQRLGQLMSVIDKEQGQVLMDVLAKLKRNLTIFD
ncbi:MarR family winged helix-turn-helix transcriptional regulator [Methylophaga thalassica]|uniref:HTH-type transcriptional regulator YetL n=1 Tax=Methylophaga thalassica TaxID=40223 RepID=A0ABQ5TWN5_9GAMM|nr:MarR family transcriptional regulator [Methylophaga thalassica]WVI84528.1 MarR family transcriptional regulator [Methylophaga thalassica]GLP99603.1 putative HTH-type transcriptional regulator YetL [Methylophaga thalassica]